MSFRLNQLRDPAPDSDAPTPSPAVLAEQARPARAARDDELCRDAASRQGFRGATKEPSSIRVTAAAAAGDVCASQASQTAVR